jgi:uncharacterized membrane protein YbhN (UPF0104 family)
MMNAIRNIHWSTLLTCALAAVLLFLALRGANWSDMLATVTNAQPVYLGLASLVVSRISCVGCAGASCSAQNGPQTP